MGTIHIDGKWWRLAELDAVLTSGATLVLSESAKEAIQKCRTFLDEKVAKGGALIYGVNTGFGSLCDTAISKDDLSQLQTNLVRSHACGMASTLRLNARYPV